METTQPVSDPQWSYYQLLVAKAYASDARARAVALIDGLALDKSEMTAAIDKLKTVKPAAVMPAYVPPLGSYLIGGAVYLLKLSKYKSSTHLYADGMYVGTIGYAKANAVINEHLDTPAKAHGAVIAYAKKTGKCGVCHKTLTVQASIDAGIGPKCAKAYGL